MSVRSTRRAVVLVSGGDAVTPFTTPDLACTSGLAAGNTMTALRSHLLDDGFTVFTAPAMNDHGPVREPEPGSFGAFGRMPLVLPEELTIDSIGDIDVAGARLASLVDYLAAEHGVEEVDWVGHSNGGLFARASTRVLRERGSAVRVRSLVALGTPWLGGVPTRYLAGEIPLAEAGGDPRLEQLLESFAEHVRGADQGLAPENTLGYLDGAQGWNAAQAGILDGVPVLAVAGTHFDGYAGDPTVWPHDGLVSRSSALALGVPSSVLPEVERREFRLTHSIWVSDLFGLPWDTGMTWNEDVLAAVASFLSDVAD